MHPKRPQELFQLFAATTTLPGVGTKLASILEKRIGSYVIDVLRHLPIAIIDRSQKPALDAVVDGAIATFDVVVVKHDKPPRGVRRPWRVFCQNDTGSIELVFFHARDDYIQRLLPVGERRIISVAEHHTELRVGVRHEREERGTEKGQS